MQNVSAFYFGVYEFHDLKKNLINSIKCIYVFNLNPIQCFRVLPPFHWYRQNVVVQVTRKQNERSTRFIQIHPINT